LDGRAGRVGFYTLIDYERVDIRVGGVKRMWDQ